MVWLVSVRGSVVSCFFFFKQKTAYEIKECDWSSDVCSSDLVLREVHTVAVPFVATLAVLPGHGRVVLELVKPGEIGRASCRERV